MDINGDHTAYLEGYRKGYQDGCAAGLSGTSKLTLNEVKRNYLANVMSAHGGNKLKAAAALGISRSSLYRLLNS